MLNTNTIFQYIAEIADVGTYPSTQKKKIHIINYLFELIPPYF